MPDRPDADVARRLYQLLAEGTDQELSALLDPDVQWHVPRSSPRSGTYAGRDATLALLSNRHRHRPGWTLEVLDTLAGEHYVMAFVQHQGERDGATSVARFVHVMRTQAGRVTESWHFDEDRSQ